MFSPFISKPAENTKFGLPVCLEMSQSANHVKVIPGCFDVMSSISFFRIV